MCNSYTVMFDVCSYANSSYLQYPLWGSRVDTVLCDSIVAFAPTAVDTGLVLCHHHCTATQDYQVRNLDLRVPKSIELMCSFLPKGTEALILKAFWYICIRRPFLYLIIIVPIPGSLTSSLACGSEQVPMWGSLFAVWGMGHPMTHSRTVADMYPVMWTPWRAKATCWGLLGSCTCAPIAPACWTGTWKARVIC